MERQADGEEDSPRGESSKSAREVVDVGNVEKERKLTGKKSDKKWDHHGTLGILKVH